MMNLYRYQPVSKPFFAMPSFDPYHKWLGIPPKDQPPNHYRLLGIELFESDPDVIDAAASKQVAYLQGCATGSHVALSQKLLNEIAAARLYLLNPQKKTEYDRQLREKRVIESSPVEPPIIVEQSGFPPEVLSTPIYKKHKKSTPARMPWVFVGVGGLVAAIILNVIVHNGREEKEIVKAPATSITPSASDKNQSTKAKPKIAPKTHSEPKPQPNPIFESEPKPGKSESTVLEDPKPLPQVEAQNIDFKPGQPVVQTQPRPKESPKVKLPVPDAAAQKQAERQIKEVYGDVWTAAKANAEQQPFSRRINSLVLWNTYGFTAHDRGTDVCNVALLRGNEEIWRSNGLRIPWIVNRDTYLAVPVPGISADTVRVEIVRWHATGGGLSEVQIFNGKENIARGRQVTASAKWSGVFSESTLTDGIITPAENPRGYWLLPNETQGWAEVHLRDNSTSSLANSLLQKAKETNKNDPAHFVLLRLCRDIAVQTSDNELAFDAIDVMASEYDISVAEMKAEVIEEAFKRPRPTPGQKAIIAEAALTVIDEAIGEDNFDAAKRVGTQARQLARSPKDKELLQQIVEKIKEVDMAAKAYAEAVDAIAKSKEKPDDLEANLIAGKYECFTKGDWDKGLPMLAKGSDEELKALAAKDIAGAPSAAEQVKLGDAWWNFNGKTRAVCWYKMTIPNLTGMEQDRVGKRIATVLTSSKQWQPEFLFHNVKWIDDYVRLEGDAKIVTAVPYQGYFDVTIVARTNSTNIRMYQGPRDSGAGIIWNWEGNPRELRVTRSDGSIGTAPATPLQTDVWYRLRWIVTADGITVMVDNRVVFSEKKRATGLPTPQILGVYPSGSIVDVKFVKIVTP